MISVTFEGDRYSLDEGESLLEGLMRYGRDIPHGCRAGVCQACIMTVEDGEVASSAQKGLSEAQCKLNYVLSCQCRPTANINVRRISETGKVVRGVVVEKSRLSDNVVRLRIKAPLDYIPGQYITLWKDENLARSYSLAGHPSFNDYLELHIKCLAKGRFSQWVCKKLAVGDTLGVQGPLGKFIYAADPEQPLLLAAISTGLAPIYGILQDAILKGHSGPITLVIGASKPQNFYLTDELLYMAKKHPQLKLHFICQKGTSGFIERGDIYAFCKQALPHLHGFKVFLCGAESFVGKMRKQCFLAGADMKDISADVFLPFAKKATVSNVVNRCAS